MVRANREGLEKDLAAEALHASLVAEVRSELGVTKGQAKEIVKAFDVFVARPLERNLARIRGQDLVKRNPMIYTVRGVTRVEDWVERFFEDRETSAIEGHLGTFLEEVARIVSGGIKPGNGVDLQTDDADGVVHLYAIQAAPNTKNAGSRRSDIDALKRAARPLRTARRHVELHIGILSGKLTAGVVLAEPDISVPASEEFWARVSGKTDFWERLHRALITLSKLVKARAADEVARVKSEALALYADDAGALVVGSLARRRAPTVLSPRGQGGEE